MSASEPLAALAPPATPLGLLRKLVPGPALGTLLVFAAALGFAQALGFNHGATLILRTAILALAAVSLSLNSSALYFGTAAGAAIGALAIDFVSITAIGWTAALFELAALVLMLATMKAPARQAGAAPCPTAERA